MKNIRFLVFTIVMTLLTINIAFALSEYAIEDITGIRLREGFYKVNISRVDSNLYIIHEIDGRRVSNCYIKTKYCYEYGRRMNVIIEIINPNSNYSIGNIYF